MIRPTRKTCRARKRIRREGYCRGDLSYSLRWGQLVILSTTAVLLFCSLRSAERVARRDNFTSCSKLPNQGNAGGRAPVSYIEDFESASRVLVSIP